MEQVNFFSLIFVKNTKSGTRHSPVFLAITEMLTTTFKVLRRGGPMCHCTILFPKFEVWCFVAQNGTGFKRVF
jgi:hypothetical protein